MLLIPSLPYSPAIISSPGTAGLAVVAAHVAAAAPNKNVGAPIPNPQAPSKKLELITYCFSHSREPTTVPGPVPVPVPIPVPAFVHRPLAASSSARVAIPSTRSG